MGRGMEHKARIHPAGQVTTECLRRTVQQDRALRMAVPISLGRSAPRTARRHAVDVVLLSRAPKYGSERIYPKTAVSHGRVAFLLLAIAKNGGLPATAPFIACHLENFQNELSIYQDLGTPRAQRADTLSRKTHKP